MAGCAGCIVIVCIARCDRAAFGLKSNNCRPASQRAKGKMSPVKGGVVFWRSPDIKQRLGECDGKGGERAHIGLDVPV